MTAQFDGVVAENAESRRTIDETLQENLAIARKAYQLEDDVAKGKAEVDELVDEATSAYDQRYPPVNPYRILIHKVTQSTWKVKT